uniref:Uncharacterized protein n=1 Tax=Romanomermis culicivorax TaxID=13658 RepID=A0A915K0P4_ROMCU
MIGCTCTEIRLVTAAVNKCVPIHLENKHFRNPFNFTYAHCVLGNKVETFADPFPTTITLTPLNNTNFAISLPDCQQYHFKFEKTPCSDRFDCIGIQH